MDRPVVIVHGYADTELSPWWHDFERRLIEVGYAESEIHMIDLSYEGIPGTSVDSPRNYAKKVKRGVEGVLDNQKSKIGTELGKVDIIAHSMGGLDARWYIEELDGAENVNKLITLGTPHTGTEIANIPFWTSGGNDMVPGSEFLTKLNGSPLAEDVEYVSIWSKADEIIIPSERAKLKGAMNIHPGLFTHLLLVRSFKVFEGAILPVLKDEV